MGAYYIHRTIHVVMSTAKSKCNLTDESSLSSVTVVVADRDTDQTKIKYSNQDTLAK